MTKISQLPADSVPTGSDFLSGVQNTGTTTKSFSLSSIVNYLKTALGTNGNPVWQYLGYAQITSPIQSTTSSTFQNATGLSVTVTIPSGVTKARFTFYGITQTSNSSGVISLGLSVGGVTVQSWYSNGVGSGYNVINPFAYVHTPSAGSLTYQLLFSGDGTYKTSILAGTTPAYTSPGPAFILVECC